MLNEEGAGGPAAQIIMSRVCWCSMWWCKVVSINRILGFSSIIFADLYVKQFLRLRLVLFITPLSALSREDAYVSEAYPAILT